MKTTRFALLVGAFAASLLPAAALAAPAKLWGDIAASQIALTGPRLTTPLRARTITLDDSALRSTLAQVHSRTAGAALPQLRLPLPQGGEMAFALTETQVMAPALAAKYPQIRTYQGRALANPAITGRFQMDPRGFRAMIHTAEGRWYIDSYSRGDTRNYQSYYAKDLPVKARPGDEVLPNTSALPSLTLPKFSLPGSAGKGVSIPGNLRTYRLAFAADGEYSSFHDPQTLPNLPSKAIVLAELVNVTNRVSGVYERELGIRLQLVANNDLIIFQNPVADPYTDDQPTLLLAQNIATVNGVIGPTNYDIGHVATTGGGGVAFLGVVCGAQKAGGVTGLPTPVGDNYYIDYVAHEVGHQFGGNHTFNGNVGSCAGGNRSAASAYEPGSGVTIMAYAGICGVQNIAAHSIDTFHARSFDEIVAFSRNTATGASCGVLTTTTNRPPVVVPPVGGFTIPRGTPFELTGSASDPDGDVVRYQWEQFDLGAAGAPNAGATVTPTTPPLFRPFPPTLSPTRVFPRIEDVVRGGQEVVGGVAVLGEILPQVTRVMNFRLTVRDNYRVPNAANPDTTASFESGGVASEDLSFNVSAAAGPFVVTFPSATGLSFNGDSTQTLTWNEANTAAAPVSCPSVNVFLSTDGGLTYPTTLLSSVPNDGSNPVVMPNIDTTTARVKVRCANSVFFDISDNNFTLIKKVNTAPVAALKVVGPSTGVNSQLFSFDAGGIGGSSDAENDVLMYAFDLDGNGSFEPYGSASTATATLVCNAASGRGPCKFSPAVKVKDPSGLEGSFALTNGITVTRYENITGRVIASTSGNRTVSSTEAPAGVYEFDGRICNNSSTTPLEVFSVLTASVTSLTNGNTLLNRRSGTPAGVGALLDYPAGAFIKGACQSQKFRVGLRTRDKFTILVNLNSVVEQ